MSGDIDKEQITVDRAKFDSITLYEISEEELEKIEQGSPTSDYLNFALVLLTTFINFVATLALATVTGKAFTFFVVITVVSGILGTILLIIWLRSRGDSKSTFRKIRSRKNVEKVREITIEENVDDKSVVKGENEQETLQTTN